MKLATIILFTYNRLEHTKKTIEALQKNLLAKESKLVVYSDGGKDVHSWEKVNQVRRYLQTVSGFKEITISKRDENRGLATNIIDGVTSVLKEYHKVIVLEDDIVTSPYFLKFMNEALDFYENQKRVWHISGWNYPIETEGIEDTFLWRNMNCWGWATWRDRWCFFKKEPSKLIEEFHEGDIEHFNLDGVTNFWDQVIKNKNEEMNTWAIFWNATIALHNGLCLNPAHTYVENIGFDGTGTNTGIRENYTRDLNMQQSARMTQQVEENRLALYRIKNFFLLENMPLHFSKKLNLVANFLETRLDSQKKYLLYGAGVGAQFLWGYIQHYKIVAVVDRFKKGLFLKQLEIIDPQSLAYYSDHDIIISVFGRDREVKKFLIDEYGIDEQQIISMEHLLL